MNIICLLIHHLFCCTHGNVPNFITLGYLHEEEETNRHCFGIQLSEEEVASFKVIVEIEDGTAGRQVDFQFSSVYFANQFKYQHK